MNATAYKSPFEFVGSRIEKVKIDHTYFSMDNDNSKSREFELHTKIGDVFEHEEKLFGNVNLRVDVNVQDENNSDVSYVFNLTIDGCFSIDKDVPKDQFKEMLRINGSAALYSIARGFIMGVSAQTMLSGQITLPLLNFTDMPKESLEETS